MVNLMDSIGKVGEIMSGKVFSLTQDKNVSDAAALMTENNITSVLVLEETQLIGIFTETDIVRKVIAKGLRPEEVKLSDVMTREVISIPSTKSIIEAGKIMDEKKIKKLPVVDEGHLKGIITETDFVKSMSSSIMEVSQVTEDQLLEGPHEYDMEPGLTYLVEEPKVSEAMKMFVDKVKHGVPGLCITRTKPDVVKRDYGLINTAVLWLTEMAEYQNRVSPHLKDLEKDSMYMDEMFMVTTRFLSASQSVLLMDGLSYLITLNDFRRVMNLIDYIGDKVAESDSYFILNANPRTLDEKQMALLEEEMDLTVKS